MFDCKCNRASKHACEHQARPQGVRKKERKKEKKKKKKELRLDSNDFGFIYAGAKGNDRADSLADKVTLTSGLILGRSEVLKSLRHYLRAQSRGRHTIDRLERRGGERGSNQTKIGTISKATLGNF